MVDHSDTQRNKTVTNAFHTNNDDNSEPISDKEDENKTDSQEEDRHKAVTSEDDMVSDCVSTAQPDMVCLNTETYIERTMTNDQREDYIDVHVPLNAEQIEAEENVDKHNKTDTFFSQNSEQLETEANSDEHNVTDKSIDENTQSQSRLSQEVPGDKPTDRQGMVQTSDKEVGQTLQAPSPSHILRPRRAASSSRIANQSRGKAAARSGSQSSIVESFQKAGSEKHTKDKNRSQPNEPQPKKNGASGSNR